MSQTEQASGVDLGCVDEIVAKLGAERFRAIPILQAIQDRFRYLPLDALVRVCEITEITPSQIAGISSFYAQFRHLPVGEHLVSVCHGTACHVAGADSITEALRRHLRLEGIRDTDDQGLFTVQKVGCLGCCSLAPVMRIDHRTYGHLTREKIPEVLKRFLSEDRHQGDLSEELLGGRPPGDLVSQTQVRIGLGSCCMASGSIQVREALAETIQRLNASAVIRCGGCVGMCYKVPLVEFTDTSGLVHRYGGLTPDAMIHVARKRLRPQGFLGKVRQIADSWNAWWDWDAAWRDEDQYRISDEREAERSFFEKQRLIVLEGAGKMDPLDLEEYMAEGGYEALSKAILEMSPEQIVEEVDRSGLRGRGGAGFPTGRKWSLVRAQASFPKYVVMNGDEGDPGAFMDRMLLESYPHRVIEGVMIAARAVGASEGILYIRAEYPVAVQRVSRALQQAENAGFLGQRILGTDFSLRLTIMEGAGAFVCGEETGLLASIEGNRGMPRFRPPFPAKAGLWGQPTNINNVETYAAVPWILRHGGEALARIGTEKSKGTKVFALAGRIRRAGLIEVPMGVTVREVVENIGGGIRDNKTFKAVQIGGPSGGCLPAEMADTPIDYEALTQTGAIMGSGGLVVMDEDTCMVDIARYFLEFTQGESCGKCTFCRVGTKRMLEILERLCRGEGVPRDLSALEELAHLVKRNSLCGLGQTAPNPVLTTLRYFRQEYEAHIQGRCLAKRCKDLITFSITDQCIGCTLCSQYCPCQAILMKPYERHEIDQGLCVRCGTCRSVCPSGAVEVN